jgi:hypothetical protein
MDTLSTTPDLARPRAGRIAPARCRMVMQGVFLWPRPLNCRWLHFVTTSADISFSRLCHIIFTLE